MDGYAVFEIGLELQRSNGFTRCLAQAGIVGDDHANVAHLPGAIDDDFDADGSFERTVFQCGPNYWLHVQEIFSQFDFIENDGVQQRGIAFACGGLKKTGGDVAQVVELGDSRRDFRGT